MKSENLALVGAITLIVSVLIATTVLLITGTFTLEQVGPFLAVLLIPMTAIAGLPIFKAALNAPSPEQSQHLQDLQSAVGHLAGQANAPQQVGTLHVVVHQPEPAPVEVRPTLPEPQPIILQSPQQQIPDMTTQSVPVPPRSPAQQRAGIPLSMIDTASVPVPPLLNFHDSGFLPTAAPLA